MAGPVSQRDGEIPAPAGPGRLKLPVAWRPAAAACTVAVLLASALLLRSCVTRVGQGAAALTEAEATVTLKARLPNAAYYSKEGREIPDGASYLVDFSGVATRAAIFPPHTDLDSGTRVRVKYIRPPFHPGLYVTEFQVEAARE
jgi:hypothetical protein